MEINDYIELKNEIEKLSKEEQIEIFKIITSNNIDYTENNNGIFINLNNIDLSIINNIKQLLIFLKKSKINTDNIEDKINKLI